MEQLIERERIARLSQDSESLKQIFFEMYKLTQTNDDIITLLTMLSKRKAQHKETFAWFLSLVFLEKKSEYEKSNTEDSFLMFVQFCMSLLKNIIEGKMYLEGERLMICEYLKNTFLAKKMYELALDIIFDMPVETFSTLSEACIIDFQLEQFRMALLNKNFLKAEIASKKIRRKYFKENPADTNLVKFKFLLFDLFVDQKKFLEASKVLIEVNEISGHKKCTVLASFYAIIGKKNEEREKLIKDLIKHQNNEEEIRSVLSLFLRDEIMPRILFKCFPGYKLESFAEDIFLAIDTHNLSVISKYCTSIKLEDLRLLMSIESVSELIEVISFVVNSKLLNCKISENTQSVRFNTCLENNTFERVDDVLDMLTEASHLIVKENLKCGVNKE